MRRLEGRVAIITGAGDGIGRGVARRLASEGARLLIAEIAEDRGRAVAAELEREFGAQAFAVRTDAGDKRSVGEMVEAAVRKFGSVDILVNNAWGGGTISRVEHKSDAELAHGLGLGFYGPFWAMRAVFPLMKERGRGNVVNVCSLNGVNAHVGTLEYNVAKEALRAATRTAAREWAPHGIVLNAICPAAKSAAFRRVMAEHPELETAADAANPMGRIGDPERDIAPVVAFLASDDARYLTGNTLFVDGGAHINGVSWAPVLPD